MLSDAEADFLINGHINNYLITILNSPEKEKYSANEAKNQRVPVVVWPRAWRRRKKSGKRTENRVPGGGTVHVKGPDVQRNWVIPRESCHSSELRA